MRCRGGRDVCRLDDEVAERGAEVEYLEHGVGITKQECQKLKRTRAIRCRRVK